MSPDLRIGDAERDAAVAALGEHFAAGRLDAQEYDDRTSAAWAARSAGALTPLFADLPAPHPARPASTEPVPRPDAAARRLRFAIIPVLALLGALAALTHVPWFAVAIVAWVWFARGRHGGWHHGGPWHSGHQWHARPIPSRQES
jgi:hypothetical protein